MKQTWTRSITMKQLRMAALALTVVALAAPARAQVAPVYMTVDGVRLENLSIKVTGVVQGAAGPTTREIMFTYGTEAARLAAYETCSRLLLLALSKPGQYLAEANLNRCAVVLVAP